MQAIQVINGATAPQDAKTYTISPEGKALANIPEWKLLADPNYIKVADRTALNRAIYNSHMESVDSSGTTVAVPTGTFSNGASAFSPTNESNIRLNPDIAFPTSDWSVVFVAKPSAKTDTNLNCILAGNTYNSDTTMISPKIGFSPSGSALYIARGGAIQQEGSYRLTYTPSTPLVNELAVYIVTGSSKNGLSIYKNGEKVASSESEAAKTPLNNQTGAGEWHVLRGVRGLFGYIGVLGIDLNDATNEAYREKINSFLMQKHIL